LTFISPKLSTSTSNLFVLVSCYSLSVCGCGIGTNKRSHIYSQENQYYREQVDCDLCVTSN
jgi:hypothetical protein